MDSETVNRIAGGDERALGEVYDRFANVIYGMAMRVTRDKQAAEDVTQDVFVHLWQNCTQFDDTRGTLKSWLCTIAHHRAVDRLRQIQAQRHRDSRHFAESQPLQTLDDMFESSTTNDELLQALNSLPTEQAEAIKMAYFDGKTYREVAKELKIPEGTAKSRIRLGLRHLVDALKDPKTAEVWS